MSFTFVDFFAGIGGFHYAMEAVGGKCVAAAELNEKARISYQANHTIHGPFYKDVTEIDVNEMPDFDVMCAGFPCQAFSVGGKRRGFNDTRGTLFFDIARIIKAKTPRIVFLENVEHLYHHDNGWTWHVIKETLAGLGYRVKYALMNTKDHGNLPQNRKRIFIVAFREKEDFDTFNFPEEMTLTNSIEKVIDYDGVKDSKHYIPANTRLKAGKIAHASNLKKGEIYNYAFSGLRTNKKKVCFTLLAQMAHHKGNLPIVIDNGGIRYITPREALDFQGFPKDFVISENLKDDDIYMQAGNSVSVPVVKRIATKIVQSCNYFDPLDTQFETLKAA